MTNDSILYLQVQNNTKEPISAGLATQEDCERLGPGARGYVESCLGRIRWRTDLNPILLLSRNVS